MSETETERLEPERTEPTAASSPEVTVEAEAAVEDVAEPVVTEPVITEDAEPEAPTEPEAVTDGAAEPEAVTAPEAAEPEAVTDDAAEPTAEEPTDAAAEAAEPAPAPVPVPKPSALPHPPRPRPVPRPAAAAAPVAAPAPAPTDLTPEEAIEAASFGRVDAEGSVWVREAAGERLVGQFPGGDPVEAVALYVRRYGDLRAKVLLLEQRLAADVHAKDAEQSIDLLATELAEAAAVGDLDGLRARLGALSMAAAERKARADAERAAAKAAAIEARTALVEEAEKIAGVDPSRMQWRPAGEQLRVLLDRWKDAQRNGPRIDRPTEDALWKRFSHARSSFDRERRRFFSELEKSNTAAKDVKAAIVAKAEALATSTDWGATAATFRDLMDQWKNAGRAGRKDDDALWARFRAAQDAFFAAREAQNKATDAEFSANLEVKLGLLTRAEALVPVTDLAAAKAALRDIQDAWEKAGKVPRADIQRVEGRLRAVEQAVRDAEQTNWRRTNPETRARAEGAAAQLHAAIAGLEADLAKATAAGDQRKIAEATAALAARRQWLEQVERAAAESR